MSLCFCFHVTHSLTNGPPHHLRPQPQSSPLSSSSSSSTPPNNNVKPRCCLFSDKCPVGGRSKGSFYRILSSLRAIVTPERLFLAPFSASWSAKLFFSLFLTHIVFSAICCLHSLTSIWQRVTTMYISATESRTDMFSHFCSAVPTVSMFLMQTGKIPVQKSGRIWPVRFLFEYYKFHLYDSQKVNHSDLKITFKKSSANQGHSALRADFAAPVFQMLCHKVFSKSEMEKLILSIRWTYYTDGPIWLLPMYYSF